MARMGSSLTGASSLPEEFLSVWDIVHRRMGVDADPWHLALVQRDEVWGDVRMRSLLDSLLAHYPIGSLLLCSVEQPTQAISVDGLRSLVTDEADIPQLLDGQQRIHALYSIFCKGGHGTFFLDMTTPRDPPSPASARGAKERALKYIAWRPVDPDLDAGGGDGIEVELLASRERFINLSRWFDHADDVVDLVQHGVTPDNVVTILRKVDPMFAEALDEPTLTVAAERLTRLVSVWTESRIPVVTARVHEPLDVLEVFNRVNRGGVPVREDDVYFAAVKTFWPAANGVIPQMVEVSCGLLTQPHALSLLSRLAARGLGLGDMVPLNVDRLAGEQQQPLRAAMEALAPRVLDRITTFTHLLVEHSSLGLGLKYVSVRLWEEMFAWAVASQSVDEEWFERNRASIEAYLLGASVFRYPVIFGDSFRRLTFSEALSAGIADGEFPVERVAAVTRNHYERLAKVADQETPQLALSSPQLLLAVAQGLSFATRDTDWDHIVAVNHKSRMHVRSGTRSRAHDLHGYLEWPGNLWALNLGANRAVQDMLPELKFNQLRGHRSSGAYPVWEDANWFITPEQEAQFSAVGRLLGTKKAGVLLDEATLDDAMSQFRDVVVARTAALVDTALSRYPRIRSFARDSGLEAADPSPFPVAGLDARLGISDIRTRMQQQAEARRREAAKVSDSNAFLALAGNWERREDELVWVAAEVTSKQTRITDPNTFTRHRFRWTRTWGRAVPLRGPDPGSHLDVCVDGRRTETGQTPLWISVPKDAKGYETVRRRLQDAGYTPELSEKRLWVGIPLDPERRRDGLLKDAMARVAQIRQVVETEPASASPVGDGNSTQATS